MKKYQLVYLGLIVISGLNSCKKEKEDEPTESSVITGWNGNDDPSTVPTNIHFGNNQNVPSFIDLTPKFPPIGNQGNYGTCVAWSSGYGIKTALEGMDLGLTSGQLAQTSNQISPRDLFTAIPDSKKGANCNGTNFTDALDVLLSRGSATLQTVPYTSLNGCSNANLQSSWTQEAGNHKIKSYRKIDLTVASIQENLANSIPVLCGAKLSDNFMTWNDDNVMSSNTTYNQTGIHSYHALAIAGYDNNKGPNGAFRIVNSWGPQWGDAGLIWVDYNFFISEFCFGGNVYIAVNDKGNNPPPNNDTTVVGSVDLAAWAFADNSLGFNSTAGFYERNIEYNIYNIGDQNASATQDWEFDYIYYNAYNANDWGFLFWDAINTSVPQGGPPVWQNDHYTLNFDIPPGENLGNMAFQSASIQQGYYVPNISGYYYLLIVADGGDVFPEQDEQNNLFYTSGQYPITFINGEVQKNGNAKPVVNLKTYNFKNYLTPEPGHLKKNPFQTTVNKTYPNAYSVDEIKTMLRNQKNSPAWNQKILEFKMRVNHKINSKK